MNCLIENEYIRELSKKNTYVFPNELSNWKRIHKGTSPQKNTYVFPNELPNWKRIHKGTFQKKTRMYSQMNCLIENEYIRELSKKKHVCIPKWIA